MADSIKKILVIDDERDIVACLQGVFQNFKHIQLLTALNGHQGIGLAKQEKPQVILLDLRMPGLNGEETLRELKPILPETKFIVMTGWEDGQTRNRIQHEIGVDAYFDKPFELEKLVDKVLQLVEGA